MESYRIQQTGSGKIALDRKAGMLDPVGTKSGIRDRDRRSWRRCLASSPN